jgi:hypothetical protein
VCVWFFLLHLAAALVVVAAAVDSLWFSPFFTRFRLNAPVGLFITLLLLLLVADILLEEPPKQSLLFPWRGSSRGGRRVTVFGRSRGRRGRSGGRFGLLSVQMMVMVRIVQIHGG